MAGAPSRPDKPVPVFPTAGAVDLGGLLRSMIEGFALHEMVLDAQGAAVDYRFITVNRAFESITGLRAAEVVGRTAGELLGSPDPSALERYGEVARTGVPARFLQNNPVMDSVWEVAAYRPAPGMVVCLFADATERHRTARESRRNETRLQSLLAISERGSAGVEGLMEFALSEALSLTESPLGYIYHYDESHRVLTLGCWSAEVLKACRVREKQRVHRLEETGIWGEALRQRAPVLLNDFAAPHPLKRGLPEGHAPIARFLAVPVFSGQAIVAMVGVANKTTPYDDGDVRQLKLLMEPTWRIVERARAEEERVRLQDELAHVQRIESIAQLAGGTAHGINNMLTPVLGYADLLREDPALPEPLRPFAQEIRRAAEKARDLTSQLLAVGRRQSLALRPLDVRRALLDLEPTLRSELGPAIRVHLDLQTRSGIVQADAAHLTRVLLTLADNARDAMPAGGSLSIALRDERLDERSIAALPELSPGLYVKVKVTDTGRGMDAATLRRIFEPFHTTKPHGQGTGLGLSAAYGIIRQHGGTLRARSEPGGGATFEIYLPQAVPAEEAPASPGGRGSEIVLVVEDVPAVRQLAARILDEQGYGVLVAGSVEEAIREAQASARIDLLLTDVVMPGDNGRRLYERLRERLPAMKVLYMSGYSQTLVGAPDGVLPEGAAFLQKPFSVQELGAKVRLVLDG